MRLDNRSRLGIGILPAFAFALLCLASTAHAQPAKARVLRLSVPYINSFCLQPRGEPNAKTSTGFWGFGVGLLIGHSASQYIGLNASVAIDYEVGVPVGIDEVGEQESATAYAIDLTNNHIRGRFSLGYGLAYGTNRWNRDYFPDSDASPPTRDPVELRSSSLGLVFPACYALNDRFALGLTYRPYLYRFGADAGFRYEHVISIDVSWSLGLF